MKIQDVLKVSFGNIIEWYDFSLFGFYATVMNRVFFPDYSKTAGLVMIFGMFGIGFIARPFGGYFLGRIGDKYGHKLAINLAILGMSFATLMMAILPGHGLIGSGSILLLLLLRLIQGVSAGGQFTGVLTLSVNESTKNRAFLSMVSVAISTAGFFLASIVVFILDKLLPDAWGPYAWRCAFLISVILFYVYWRIRPQTSEGHEHAPATEKYSFTRILSEQPLAFLGSIILSFVTGLFYFFIYTYMFNYLKLNYSLSGDFAEFASTLQILFGCFVFLLFGWLADRYGKIRLFTMSMFVTPILLFLLFNAHNLNSVFIIMFILTITHCAMSGGSYSVMVEVFYERWRMTGSSLSYNIGVGFAGFGPMLIQFVVNHSTSYQPIVYLSIGCCVLGLFGAYLIRKSNGYTLIT